MERVVTVIPSKKVSVIRVSRLVDEDDDGEGKMKPIKNGEVLQLVAGTTLSDLCFSLTDEAGRYTDDMAATLSANTFR